MFKQVKDAPGNPLYWVCQTCNWPTKSLQDANKHSLSCGLEKPVEPAFQSFTRGNKDE